MAILSNINGKFAVDSTGAIQLSGSAGAANEVLVSGGAGAAPTWVVGSTVIGGPYLPLTGGILTGATSTASGITFTSGGTVSVNATTSLLLALNSTNANGGYLRIMKSGATEFFIGTRDSVSGTSGTGYDIYTIAGNDLRFFTNGTNLALTIDTSQNVGIGTATPNRPLTIQSNSGATAISIYARVADDYGFIQFFANNQTTLWSEIAGRPSNLSFYQNSTEVLRLGVASSYFPSGDVGIGTISPNPFSWGTRHLTVQSGGTNTYAAVDIIGSGSGAGALLFGGGSGSGTASNIGRAQISGLDGSHLVFSTNASNSGSSFTERMRITDYGSLCVGNVAGTNLNWGKIQCGGTITVGNSSGTYNTYGRIYGSSTSGLHLIGTTTGIYSSTEGIFVQGPKVGMGTSDIDFELQVGGTDVSGSASFSAQFAVLSEATTGYPSGFIFKAPRVATSSNRVLLNEDFGTYFSSQVYATSTAGAQSDIPIVFAPLGGNVGIGIAAPTHKLHVYSAAPTGGIGLKVESGNATNWIQNKCTAGSWQIGSTGSGFQLYNDDTASYRFTVQNGGNVGIGTTSPGSILEVVDTSATATTLTLGQTGEVPEIKAGGANTDLRLSAVGAGGWLDLQTNATSRMRIMGGGNVGINDTSPGTKLSINGANYVEMATFCAASGSTSGIVTNNVGYVTGFTTSATHVNSNAALFIPVTNGIKITKAGLLHVTVTQDFISTLSSGYCSVQIRKNGTIMFYSLRTNSNNQWEMINSTGTMLVAANDEIGFYYSATDFISMDTGSWSQYSFIWTSR